MAKSLPIVHLHEPSVLLSWEENNSIFLLLSRGQSALATAVAQLLISCSPDHKKWQLFATGVLCFVKYNRKRSYYFHLYDFDEKKLIWEQEIYIDINYIQVEHFFHMFEGDNCVVAFNFADQTDAKNFGIAVQEKVHLINKMMNKQKPTEDLKQNLSLDVPNMSSMRSRSLDSLQTKDKNLKSTAKPTKKSKSKTPRTSKLEIGLPTDFRHIQHIGWNPSTGFDFNVIDPKLQSFFEIAGVSADQLDDIDTRKFIFNFIDTHGGIEAAIQGPTQPNQIITKNDKKESNKAMPKPTSSSSSSVLPPPPPPPPPPPALMPTEPHESTKASPEKLKNEKDSPQHLSNAIEVGHGHNALLEQIRSGINLKSSATARNDSQLTPSIHINSSNSLADALSAALQNRFRANQMANSLDNDSDSSNDEWND